MSQRSAQRGPFQASVTKTCKTCFPKDLIDLWTDANAGAQMSFPVFIAPMAMQGMAHPGREVAAARAAKRAGIPYVS